MVQIIVRFPLLLSCLLIAASRFAFGGAPPLVAGTPTFTFPQFSAGHPFRLVAYGDSRFTNPSDTTHTNPRVRAWLADRVAQEHPSAILLTGDTPFTGADPLDWQVFQQETTSWRSIHSLVLPATGNHEGKGGVQAGMRNFDANFPYLQGHHFYSAILGNVEVISLDYFEPMGTGSTQLVWFAAQLDHVPRSVQFVLILFHVPPVADPQSKMLVNIPTGASLTVRNTLESHLSRLKAKVVVFSGHIHNYERFERKGVEYVVTGGGGAAPYPVLFRGSADLYRDLAFPVYHYVTVDIAPGRLHAVMWKVKDPLAGTLEVEAKDEFSLTVPVRVPARPAKRR